LVDAVMNVLQQFNDREQLIVQLYYFEELTLKEISEILKITESRISQIHKTVINKIQKAVIAKDE
jgi:RNA polymerase sigma factor for flagellar operon FliA